MDEQPKETRMRIQPTPHDKWPHCLASIAPVKIEDGVWEYRFSVPIPEKLWEGRAHWFIGGSYWKHLVKQGNEIDVVIEGGYVKKVVLKGSLGYKKTLELDLNCPGPPFEPTNYHSGPERDACLVDSITPEDYESAFVEGTCENCEEEVPEGADTCPECGASQSQEAPTVGELVEKYGPDARMYVSWHDRDVSLNIKYTLDNEGIANEAADTLAKYSAEMAEYGALKIEWDELAEKVSAYGEADTEASERAKLAELQAKYEA